MFSRCLSSLAPMRWPTLMVALLLLASCSSSSLNTGLNEKEKAPPATLADLAPAALPDTEKPLPQVNLDTLVETYRQVLEVSEDSELRLRVLHRLAGLEMRRGEQKLFEEQTGRDEFALAVEAYQTLIRNNPGHPRNDLLLYQLSKAYDLGTQTEQSMAVLNRLVVEYPGSIHYAEAQFRRGEFFFAAGDYRQASQAYAEVINKGKQTSYYANALYMYGWSLFKRERYTDALEPFTEVLFLLIPEDNNLNRLQSGDRQLANDVFKVMSVAFSYLDGAASIADTYNAINEPHFIHMLYDQLGKLYLKQERYRDSAETYRLFVQKYPQSKYSPTFYASLIRAYVSAGFVEDVLNEKQNFVRYYGIHGEYWAGTSTENKTYIRPFLKIYIPELARYYHAKAQQTAADLNKKSFTAKRKPKQLDALQKQQQQDFIVAGDYYQQFIDTFPVDDQVPEMRFLLAESRFEAGRFEQAIESYEIVAYQYPDTKRGAEAGYAAIVSYNELIQGLPAEAQRSPQRGISKSEKWLREKIASQLRFANSYQNDARAPAVLTKSAEELLSLQDYLPAIKAADQLLRKQPPADKALRKTAWLVVGHSEFELLNYAGAEQAYGETLALLSRNDADRAAIVDRRSASVYKQAEQALAAGNSQQAVDNYLRIDALAPDSEIAVTAQFDAANVLMDMQNYPDAISVLERFRRNYPNNKLTATIPAKLVVALQGSGQWAKAADELTAIYRNSSDRAVKTESLYQAAELYEQAGDIDSAIDRYRSYANNFPEPFAAAMEARYKLSELYAQRGQGDKRRFWLNKMIVADRKAGANRTERSRYLAALSSTVLADDAYQAYRGIALKLPLKTSLKKKKKALNKALKAYTQVIDYGVEEFATLSTYRIGAIYSQLSNDLMDSQRPNNLDELALEQYELLLEEQAFPFEERAIEIHQSNAERSWDGIYDEWVKESFTALQTLLPARYGKQERGADFSNEIY